MTWTLKLDSRYKDDDSARASDRSTRISLVLFFCFWFSGLICTAWVGILVRDLSVIFGVSLGFSFGCEFKV